MSETSDKLQEIIDFFQDGEGYDKNDVITDIAGEIEEIKGMATDEIGLEWGGEDLMLLEDFTQQFYEKLIGKVCNVIRSFR